MGGERAKFFGGKSKEIFGRKKLNFHSKFSSKNFFFDEKKSRRKLWVPASSIVL
jgi:hypothetical protein